MIPRIWSLAALALIRAVSIIDSFIPDIFISICRAVIPDSVPATLKSISPRWSSSPKISVKTANSSPSLISPIAMPATGLERGTPASIKDKEVPHTDAIELEPLDSVISETTRIVYPKSSTSGNTALIALFAKFPWPISRLFGPIGIPISPTLYAGKL